MNRTKNFIKHSSSAISSNESFFYKLFVRRCNNMSYMQKILSVTIFYLFLTIPIIANDFYPLNVKPTYGEVYKLDLPIPINFDICLGYDFPALAGEWNVEITILNESGTTVHTETIQGFNANGPACFPINNASDFIPLSVGK